MSNTNEYIENIIDTYTNKKKLLASLLSSEKEALFCELENILHTAEDLKGSGISDLESAEIQNLSDMIINFEKSFTNELTNCSENDNNVLLISEKEQKAFLPYRYLDVVKILKNNTTIYSSIHDVIDELYVLPLDRFKHSAISRFREAFNLVMHMENGSIVKALDLGFELMFMYELNPIIIAACRNLDELDIYLDCLAENEVDKFDCFEIKFEVAPQVLKQTPAYIVEK